MPSKRPRLRGKGKARPSPYLLGEFPDDVVINIGSQIVHRLAVGHANIAGDDFAGIFADAISGEHRAKPVGVTDITWDECSWSAKTIQASRPFGQKKVRLISGRNSPDYSYGISNPLDDIQETGSAVLNIWNERVNRSFNVYSDLRVVVLIRNMATLQFVLFEYEAIRYPPANFKWELNRNGNLEGREKTTGEHVFTWQPHGSQFTVIKKVPGSAYKFRIRRNPGLVAPRHILRLIRFKPNWIEKVE